MNSLWLLTKKNLKLLLRSKSSALIVVFAPLLIILILGLSFSNSSQYGINIGVYASSFNEDVNSFMETLQEEEFKVVKYENSIEECIEDIKLSYVHTCISLPDSFQIDGNTKKEITFHIDPSKINLVWMVQETLRTKLNLKSEEVSKTLAGNILTKLADTNTKISSDKDKLGTIKEKTTNALSSAETAKTGLSGLDFTVPETVYNLSVTEAFKTQIFANINTGITKLDTATSTIDKANLSSSEKSAIKKHLKLAKNELENASARLTVDSEGSFVAVNNLINTLQTDLTATKGKLTSVSEKVTGTTTDLGNIQSSLGEGIGSLDTVLTSLNEIKANLDAQKVTEAGVISNPITTKIENVIPAQSYLSYMFPALIVLVIMFSSLLLGTTLVMMEKNSPSFVRNYFVPVKKVTFILSTYLTNLILMIVQIAIILGISLIFLKELYLTLPQTVLILFLAASVFTFLGMALGYLFVSEETAVLASISLGSVFLFFSGLILPLESVSILLREITFFNPFVLAEKLVREVSLFQTSLSLIWMDLLILLGYAVVMFLIILIIESLLHKQLVTKFMRHHHKSHRQKQKMDGKKH